MRTELQPGYVLHTRPFRDSSLILDCLTQDYGRLSLVARGARSPKSRQRQLCQPFAPLLLSWQGKSSLKTLIGIESRGPSLQLQADYLFSGFYLNELLIRLLPEQDPCADIYQYYGDTLSQLQQQQPLEPALRSFELGLLEALGYSVNLSTEALTGIPLAADGCYRWQPETGWLPALPNAAGPLFSGRHLLAMAAGDYSAADTRQQAKRLTRLLYQPLLGNKPLASRALFKRH